MSRKLKIRLSLLGSILFWLLFAGSNMYLLIVSSYDIKVENPRLFPQLFLSFFVACTYFYYRFITNKADSLNFTELLWRVFITGLVTTLISLAIQLFFTVFSDSSIVENPNTINLFYSILIGLVIIFIVSTFVVWKRLILYQKSKRLLQLWGFFEIALTIALAFDFFNFKIEDNNYRVGLIIIILFSLLLSFNLKWIAYLNFKQKWKSILFILLSGIYLYHFGVNLLRFRATDVLVIDLIDRVFVIGLLAFLFLYAIISILVTLFNLPTSSVFEQKLKEAIDFQKLSQTIPRGQTKDQTYEVLLESSMSAVFADAAWLELIEDEVKCQTIRNLNEIQIDEIKGNVTDGPIKEIINFEFSQNQAVVKLNDALKHPQFKSIIALPIFVQNEQIGYIILLNELSDAFNREMVNIITTFVNQASVSLENLVLIKESIENERYKEQLKIAQSVQKSLLPNQLVDTEVIKMEAYSMAADEVGGDYYDYLKIDEYHYVFIIGDVSGKGTSAAFHMAQMKGIFHSLSSQNPTVDEFMKKANVALSHCLEKSSFITSTYFSIDLKKHEISFARAGHCPTLFYNHSTEETAYLKSDGLGLGIIRNSSYEKYVYPNTVQYQAGDTLLLFTDGITEAKNSAGEQYGNDRLKASFSNHAPHSPDLIKNGIINDLSIFLGTELIDDDYTVVIIKLEK